MHKKDDLGSHLKEEGSLDYDGGLVRLQVQLKFDTNMHLQHVGRAKFVLIEWNIINAIP
jgi:hypothetical protein